MRAGDSWNQVLLDVIARRVDYVVVVQTLAMARATKGVFNREIDAALVRQAEMGEYEGQKLRFLIPVKIGACALLSPLRAQHAIDVSQADGVGLLVTSILEDWDKRLKLKSRSLGVA